MSAFKITRNYMAETRKPRNTGVKEQCFKSLALEMRLTPTIRRVPNIRVPILGSLHAHHPRKGGQYILLITACQKDCNKPRKIQQQGS